MQEDDRLLTVPQAANRLTYKVRKVWQMLSEGIFTRIKLDPNKPKSATRILESEIIAYLARISEGRRAAN